MHGQQNIKKTSNTFLVGKSEVKDRWKDLRVDET